MPDRPDRTAKSVAGKRVTELGEYRLLERIRARVPPAPSWVMIGIGDDGAVIEPARGRLDVVTTDAMVEGVHFDRAFVTPADLGYKALAINLSDLAAMGAEPRVGVLSLFLPPDLTLDDLDRLLDGLLGLAGQHHLELVGGNLTRSPGPLCIDITAIGTVRRRTVLTRKGARPGDGLYVTGAIGNAAAGLEWLKTQGQTPDTGNEMASCVERFLRPEPRVRAGLRVGRNRVATSAMDLSDGLADAVTKLTQPLGLGAIVEADAIPLQDAARHWFAAQDRDPIVAALSGGEDYELLFTLPDRPRSRAHLLAHLVKPLSVTRVGTVTNTPDLLLRRPEGDEPLPTGFQHF